MVRRSVLAIFSVFLCVLVNGIPLDDTDSNRITAATTTSASTPTVASEPEAVSTSNLETSESKKYLTADDVPVCQQNNADLGSCVKRIFEIMMPRLKDGNKELNIPALDPFALNRTTVQAAFGPVKGRITLKRALVHGLSNTQYKTVDVNVKENKLRMIAESYVPQVQALGTYKADVSVNNAHMRPKGTFNVTLFDMNLKTWSDCELYEKDGHRFVRVINLEADPKVSGMKINVTGIFEDPQLNEIVVNVVNQYWREIYTALLPQIRTYWEPLVLRTINEALTVVPFDSYVKNE